MPGDPPSRPDKDVGEGFAFLAAILLCCLLAAFLGASWGRNSGNLQPFTRQAAALEKVYCEGLSGRELIKCKVDQTSKASDSYSASLDLRAQQDMAIWAFAMFIANCLTLGLTLWALIYVRGTFIATRDALIDTGRATEAMLQANQIASHTQRPWIDIDAQLISFRRLEQRAISLDWIVTFTNTGQMLAERFNCNVRVVAMDADFLDHMGDWFDRFIREDRQRDSVLVPKQSSTFAGQANHSIEHLPWECRENFRKDCTLMILAMAAYNIPGDQTRRYALKGFSVGENRSVIDNRRLIYDSILDLTLEKLLIQPMGRSRAN